jgi:hypothetical protein
MLQPPLKEILSQDYKHRGVTKEVTSALLQRKKIWIVGVEKSCSLFLGMMTQLNLVESNCPSPHDSIS